MFQNTAGSFKKHKQIMTALQADVGFNAQKSYGTR